jgi:hypothetical protein
VLVATDFFTIKVWTWCGLVTYYLLFFIHKASKQVCSAIQSSRVIISRRSMKIESTVSLGIFLIP